jgi:hypothetical protein
MSDIKPEDKAYTEPVSFRDTKRIVTKVDHLASARGTDRSGMYRLAMRYWLGANSHLAEEEKKALGLNGEARKQGS